LKEKIERMNKLILKKLKREEKYKVIEPSRPADNARGGVGNTNILKTEKTESLISSTDSNSNSTHNSSLTNNSHNTTEP
jgi:hypothetical protein